MNRKKHMCARCGETFERGGPHTCSPKLAEVVKLNDGRPLLSDIPARLRFLADEIERGDYPECSTAIVLLNKDGWPDVLQYGTVEGESHPLIVLQLALAWMTDRITKRRG